MALVCQSLELVTALNTRDHPLGHYAFTQASRAGSGQRETLWIPSSQMPWGCRAHGTP